MISADWSETFTLLPCGCAYARVRTLVVQTLVVSGRVGSSWIRLYKFYVFLVWRTAVREHESAGAPPAAHSRWPSRGAAHVDGAVGVDRPEGRQRGQQRHVVPHDLRDGLPLARRAGTKLSPQHIPLPQPPEPPDAGGDRWRLGLLCHGSSGRCGRGALGADAP